MSFFHKELREWVLTHLMNDSTDHTPKKDPDFVDDIPEDTMLPESENPVVPEKKAETAIFLTGDELTREFSFNRDVQRPHTLHLCLYLVNRTLPTPFLEYYLEKVGTEYRFPEKELPADLFNDFVQGSEEPRIEPLTEEPSDAVEGEPDIDDEFVAKITEFFEETVGSPLDPQRYKGFLEIDDHIFAVIDANTLLLKDKENIRWAILDEIVQKQAILGTALSPLTVELFQKNAILGKLDNVSTTPQVLYLCKKNGDQYENVYYEEGKNAHNSISIINEKVLHPQLKTVYLFTTAPLPSEYPLERIKRYAVFLDPQNKVEGERVPSESVVGIEENGVEYWGTKSPKYFVEI
jgi:hypothetical protein